MSRRRDAISAYQAFHDNATTAATSPWSEGGGGLLRLAVDQFSLSARAYHRVLKLARTIADLVGQHTIAAAHVAEALQYRRRQP